MMVYRLDYEKNLLKVCVELVLGLEVVEVKIWKAVYVRIRFDLGS